VNRLRRVVQWLWAGLLLATGCVWWAKRQLRRQGALVVLMFHRVMDEADHRRTQSLTGIVVQRLTFQRLAEYIARRCEPVSLSTASPGSPGSKVRVALTFDDGWRDNFTTALPIAQAHNLPLTVFICPGLTGRRSPFWPERIAAAVRARQPMISEAGLESLIEQLKKMATEERGSWLKEYLAQNGEGGARTVLSDADTTLFWQEISAMDRAGVRFGSHTYSHRILTTLAPNEARRELQDSKHAIERALGSPCDWFAYPNGECSAETRQIVAEEGFRLAFTTESGAWTSDCDRLAIPRLNVYEDNLIGLTGDFSPAMFEYTTFWKAWRAMKTNSRPAMRADERRVSATA
jgi:peptidoglycan/xylan/chitin deacetylase (PgdA/CDA1 family)